MSKIVLISSGPSIAHYGLLLQKSLSHPENFLIVDMYMEDALDYVRYNLPKDTDVIIARGNTAKLLKASHLSVPVVTVPVRDSELIQSVQTARELYKQEDSSIAYFGLEDVLQSVRGFLSILHCNIRLYQVNSSEDIRACIKRAKREHVRVVIGGIYTQKLAAEAGLDCVLLESSLSSVKEAYERALEVQKGFILQRKKFQERNILLNSITDGIISINEKGKITVCNPAAEKYLELPSASVSGKSYISLFSQTENELIQQCLLSGQQVSDHPFPIKEQDFLFSIHPVFVGTDNKGIILTFRPAGKTTFLPADSIKSKNLLPAFPSFFDLTGSHSFFQMAVSRGLKYASLSAPILLIGEEGTGKETFARCIHQAGSRNGQLFISREASLLTKEDLLSSHQGTLYIRNGHRLSPDMQELLGDILKTGSVAMENHTRKSLDIRLIIGSDSDLSKGLLPDFYYLINTLILPLPALRQRVSDIPSLGSYMVDRLCLEYKKSCQCTPEFLHGLADLSWPGNLKQMESYLRRLVILAEDNDCFSSVKEAGFPDDSEFYSHLKKDFLPSSFPSAAPPQPKPGFTIKGRPVTYEELRKLDAYYNGKKGVIAEKLGISRSTLWRYYKEMEQGAV